MRTDAPVPEHPAPPSSPASPQRIRLIDRITAYRQPIGLVFTLLLFGLALVACYHLLREIDPGALHDAIADVPRPALLGALGATALGFVILLDYEWSASRFAGVTLPMRSLATGGFSAFAIGNAVGLSLLSGGSVRYRLYSRHGIGAAEIARMTLFASLSLGCALPVLAALAALCDLDDAASALHLPHALVAVIAIAVLSLAVGLVAFLARHRLPGERPSPDSLLVRLGRRSLRLPGLRLSLLQLLITALDVAAAATVLYLLLPETPPFAAFLLVYLLALAAGVLSHVPGGVGVFEAVLLAAFAGQLGAAPLAAALLLYRLIYVVLPLLLACLLLLFLEARRLWVTRQAIRVASGFAAPILAILVFLSGVVLLFSGATPAIDTRLE
ncbi:lysylphosphatidylglycerol synthetase family protein, partial [Pseudomonas aeruginosa]|nr:lysylphosphatidylglycerol synthetase family protein [Pseudomonas aeruginosa]